MTESRPVFVLLPGRKEENDHYQLLQEETALAAGARLGLRVEVSWAPAFDQLRTLKKRFLELLHRFWAESRPLPLRSFTAPSPYPPA